VRLPRRLDQVKQAVRHGLAVHDQAATEEPMPAGSGEAMPC
jgi:hypothetical protein